MTNSWSALTQQIHVFHTQMGVNTVSTVTVAWDETSRWEEVGKKDGGFSVFCGLTESKFRKQACERRCMTNHTKLGKGPFMSEYMM